MVNDDGSLLFSALKEYEYLPLNEIDNNLPLAVDNGNFDVVTYDSQGKETARRTIKVDMNSNNSKYSTLQGIVDQINTSLIDDNKDNNPDDDVDDYYNAKIINGHIILNKKIDDSTYVGLDNDSANFGGAFGINQFFEGSHASDIELKKEFQKNPDEINAYKAPNEGNNEVANSILQLQFKKTNFHQDKQTYSNTVYGYYKSSTSSLANKIQNVSTQEDATKTLFTNISNEYYSLSGVNIDEELINLEKYQRGYQANAKVITTINQMLDSLFTI